jgi:hypothetical protein
MRIHCLWFALISNDYSVPTKYAHREVTVVATVDDVKFVFEDRPDCPTSAMLEKQQLLFEPLHFLALLERKPGGFDHARPLEELGSAGLLRCSQTSPGE